MDTITRHLDTDAAPPDPLALRIRTVTVRDHDELAALLMRGDTPTDPASARERIARLSVDPATIVLVAQASTGIAGFAIVRIRQTPGDTGAAGMEPRVFAIDGVLVRPDQRGRRVGRRLLSAAVEWARARHATHVVVSTDVAGGEERRFYVGFGFGASSDGLVMVA